MATVSKLTRVFKYNGLTLPDLNPGAAHERVRDMYARTQYAELSGAEIEGPKTEGENLVYQFVKQVRTKG